MSAGNEIVSPAVSLRETAHPYDGADVLYSISTFRVGAAICRPPFRFHHFFGFVVGDDTHIVPPCGENHRSWHRTARCAIRRSVSLAFSSSSLRNTDRFARNDNLIEWLIPQDSVNCVTHSSICLPRKDAATCVSFVSVMVGTEPFSFIIRMTAPETSPAPMIGQIAPA